MAWGGFGGVYIKWGMMRGSRGRHLRIIVGRWGEGVWGSLYNIKGDMMRECRGKLIIYKDFPQDNAVWRVWMGWMAG